MISRLVMANPSPPFLAFCISKQGLLKCGTECSKYLETSKPLSCRQNGPFGLLSLGPLGANHCQSNVPESQKEPLYLYKFVDIWNSTKKKLVSLLCADSSIPVFFVLSRSNLFEESGRNLKRPLPLTHLCRVWRNARFSSLDLTLYASILQATAALPAAQPKS